VRGTTGKTRTLIHLLSFIAYLIICLQSPAAGSQQPAQNSTDPKPQSEWLSFTPETASFSVLMPVAPSERTKNGKNGIKVHTYTAKAGRTEYQLVWLTNVPQGILDRSSLKVLFPRGLEEILKSAREFGSKDLVTTHEANITLNGHQGRESIMQSASATIEAKGFIEGYDFITLAVLHPKDESSAADSKRFLDSLSLPAFKLAGSTIGVDDVGASTDAANQVDARPIPLNRPRPNYTEEARKNGIQGVVRLRALVGTDGVVKDTRFVTHLPDGLDQEAVLAVRQMRFKPAMKTGRPVPFWVMLEVEFNIRKRAR